MRIESMCLLYSRYGLVILPPYLSVPFHIIFFHASSCSFSLSSSVSALPRIILSVLDVFDRRTLSCVYLSPIVRMYLHHPLHRPTSLLACVSARGRLSRTACLSARVLVSVGSWHARIPRDCQHACDRLDACVPRACMVAREHVA